MVFRESMKRHNSGVGPKFGHDVVLAIQRHYGPEKLRKWCCEMHVTLIPIHKLDISLKTTKLYFVL